MARTYGGIGLGLSISKAYVKKIGGDIYIDSEPGKGTTFYFTIPYKPVIDKTIVLPPEKTEKTNQTILVVEDEILNYLYINEILLETNAEILLAETGQEAIDICRKRSDINLILMDIKLPDINGLEATKQIKTFRKNLPIIAQTAYAMTSDKNNALNAGCVDYIAKPLNGKKLIELVEKYSLQY